MHTCTAISLSHLAPCLFLLTTDRLQAPPKHQHLACSLPAFASAFSMLECLPYLSLPLPSCLAPTIQTWNPPVCSDLACSYHCPLTTRNTRLILCLLNQTLRPLWPQPWPAGLSVPGIQQGARPIVTIPWVSVKALMCLATQSCLTLCAWTIAHQAPLSMGILQARILEQVAMSSSRGSSQPRDRTQGSHIAGRFFTTWATREVLYT